MSNTIKIKRSASTSTPTSLWQGELAYSETSDKLFIGVGTGGAGGTATSIVTIGGAGSFLSSASAASTYQTISGMSLYLTTSTASSTYAPLASPTFTGVPVVPTATAGTNTTQAASTAFVQTAVANLVASAPSALDTLNELASALGNDANFSTTLSTSLGEKLVKSSNLSDLTSASTARTNLGLGSMATQSASSVAITGGTIDGITIDGGTF